MHQKIYVQYGCGLSAPREWINFDASPTLRIERIPLMGKIFHKNSVQFPNNVKYGNIINGLPISERSCSAVYCSHVLEHLSLSDFRVALKNTYSILQFCGIFRIVLPDLEHAINNYINDPSPLASQRFMKETSLGEETRIRTLKSFLIEWLGNSQHLWMWDYKSLHKELHETGFRKIRKASIGDSVEEAFSHVEDPSRWNNALGIECIK